MQEIECHAPYTGWKKLEMFHVTGEVKVLREEQAGGAKTILVRLPPGGEIIPHSHVAAVQHCVVEGQYETQGKVFKAGSYRLLPKRGDVAPISTRTGVTILMIYDPVSR
jgi:hypothetical protein